MKTFQFTSESVSEGHPDKICDQISDAVLDAIIALDPDCKVACETLVKTGMILVAGEISTTAWVDIEEISRKVIRNIGYDNSDIGFDWSSCAVLSAIGKQSPDIAMGVTKSDSEILGAGDQGMMFGYATSETPEFMPAPIAYAHKIMKRQSQLRKDNVLAWLRPDAKCQITFVYENSIPKYIDTIVVSTQHTPDVKYEHIKEAVIEEIIKPCIDPKYLTSHIKYFINPTGRFVVGGPLGDSGLTGRKIIVDTYGGAARHGGGCFSGKDPTKVDRSGAYIARYIAKNLVAAKLASKCEIQLSYAIGIPEPTSIMLETFNTATKPEKILIEAIKEVFDLSPAGIIKALDLKRPIYSKTATYGHFGREFDGCSFTWEKTDKINDILSCIHS